MLTQTIFPCLPQKQENIILEVSNPVLLSSTVTTDGYTVFNKKAAIYELQIPATNRTKTLKFTATEMQWLTKINEVGIVEKQSQRHSSI
ncbi:hypothetical protein A0U98_05015 [Shigella boydii]|uniref:type 3 secretion system effector OspE2 n=1 Tax=Shigella boydii TaxID=621 RepID=UPI000DF2CB67|nr:type 3 secretion system effector OspE2 [Shigella boydii]RCV94534.1 hypothetical protein A0U98_05015 [Shigella boydii]